MTTKKDGGPAFPVECDWHHLDGDVQLRGIQTGNNSGWHEGMTLRDYIAIHATKDDVHWASLVAQGNGLAVSHVEARWLFADAMIEARRKDIEGLEIMHDQEIG